MREGITPPASLRNIFKELESDLEIKRPNHGCLAQWARQGVLLLNTVLTVRAGERESHMGEGWETFTAEVLRVVSAKDEPVVFMLWGNETRRKRYLIASQHEVIESSHPSDLSAKPSRPRRAGTAGGLVVGITPPDLENNRCAVARDTPARAPASTTDRP